MIDKQTARYFWWSVGCNLWWTICFILPYFWDSPAEGIYGKAILATYICACSIGSFFFVYFLGSYRSLCAFLLPILSIIGAALSFYLIGYRTTLTPMLIDVTLHTNTEEALGVISWQVILWIILNIGIAICFVWLRWNKISLSYAWVHTLIAVVLGVSYFYGNDRLHRSLCQRFPYNIPHTILQYRSLQKSMAATRCIPIYQPDDAVDSLHIVLILGEAARADHLQLNGYERETTPRLIARKNIVSLPHIYSEHTHTLASLPYILTRADSTHRELQYSETSFISIFKEVGYHTAWISNQDLGRTFAPFTNECDTTIFANAGKSEFVFTQWLDEDLIPYMQVFQNHGSPNTLCILHSIGSHWYYNNHVPEDMCYFSPITTNKVVTGNTIEQIINSYDNTIRYMDYFADSIISVLENSKAILIYQADHGEALGEKGIFLHANDAEETKFPACFVWYSDSYAAAYPDKIKALVSNKDKRYRTDYVFYSILYAAGIVAEGDTPQMNIFR